VVIIASVPSGYADGAVATNTIAVFDLNETDPLDTNDSFDVAVDVVRVVDLGVTKSEDLDPVIAGSNLIYTISVSNDDVSDASGAVVTDELDSDVVFLSATPTQGTCDSTSTVVANNNDLTCDLGVILTGGDTTVTVVVLVLSSLSDNDRLFNRVTVESNELDSGQDNGDDFESTSVDTETDLELIALEALPQVNPLDSFSYLLEITNHGPSQATQTTLTLDVAAGVVTFLSAVPSQGTCTENSNLLTCHLGSLNSGVRATISIGFRAKDSESIKSAITDVAVSALEPDTVPGNNALQLLTRVKGEPTDDSGPVALPQPVVTPPKELVIVPDEQVNKVQPAADDEVTKVIQPDRHNVVDFKEEKLRVIFPSHVLNKTFQVRVRQREEDCTIGRSPNGQLLRCRTVDLFDTDASALEDAQLFFNATLAVILTDAEIELLGGPDAAFAAWITGELRFQRHNPNNLARPWSDITTSLGDNGEISAPALNHFSTFALVYSPGQPALRLRRLTPSPARSCRM
jgi:uncharacterized repeat protein (TIGR01451 family)